MIMKFVKTDIRVLMLVLVIGSIGGTFAIVQALDPVYDYKSPSSGAGAMLTGNVKVTQFGPDGSIIAYRQSDNHIVLQGMEIIMAQVFGGINGTYPDTATKGGTHPVRYMQIGTGSSNPNGRLLYNDTNLNTQVGGSCLRFLAAVTNASGVDGPAHGYSQADGILCGSPNSDCSAQMNITATASFYGGAPDNCAALGIDEAGIFDNSTVNQGKMFARNTFGSVDLGALDTLRLDWEFTFTDS